VKVTDSKLSQGQKQKIAKEFNFSETVFFHPANGDEPPRVYIFTPVNEMDFAGHPVIGAGHFLFRQLLGNDPSRPKSLTITTNAGPVPIIYDPENEVVSAEVPHNIHQHQQGATLAHILPVQASLKTVSDLHGVPETSPVVSVVKGVTYALVDLTERADLFANIVPGGSPALDLDEGWKPSFTGVMYYRNGGSRVEGDTVIWDLRVRMIAIDLEDPACGSGGSSLGVYLALLNGQQGRRHRFYIDQGIEMDRESHLIVDVLLDEDRKRVSTIKLAGQAAFVAEGSIFLN
jgi:PhzF family phenazine biosynthesis protein